MSKALLLLSQRPCPRPAEPVEGVIVESTSVTTAPVSTRIPAWSPEMVVPIAVTDVPEALASIPKISALIELSCKVTVPPLRAVTPRSELVMIVFHAVTSPLNSVRMPALLRTARVVSLAVIFEPTPLARRPLAPAAYVKNDDPLAMSIVPPLTA